MNKPKALFLTLSCSIYDNNNGPNYREKQDDPLELDHEFAPFQNKKFLQVVSFFKGEFMCFIQKGIPSSSTNLNSESIIKIVQRICKDMSSNLVLN